MQLLKLKIAEIHSFFQQGIWQIDLEKQQKGKYFLIKQLRILILAVRSVVEKKLVLRASALTYFTLLSIVPILAMAFGIAQGFGLEETLRQQIMNKFSGQEEVFSRALDFADSLLERTKGGVIAGVGLLTLAYTVLRLLNFIEMSFNDIWDLEKPRSLYRKFTDYTSFIAIAPIIFIISSSLTVYITSEVSEITQSIGVLSLFEPIVQFLLGFAPYVLIWLLLTMVYAIMPNTNVKFAAALLAGILAGTAYQFLQLGMIKFQIGVARYNAIYGSFAALPIFLFWLQFSWIIILFGAAYAQAFQNIKSYTYEKEHTAASLYAGKIIALATMHLLAKCFAEGEGGLTKEEIVQRLEAPGSLVQRVLQKLIACRLVAEINYQDESETVGYQPAIDVNKLDVATVLNTLEDDGNQNFDMGKNETVKKVLSLFDDIRQQMAASDHNVLIKDFSSTKLTAKETS